MFEYDSNIQSRPSPTLFEKLSSKAIQPLLYARASFSLVASVLHGVIVSAGSYTIQTGRMSYSLIGGTLHTVIASLGTYSISKGTITYSFISSVLKTVIKDVSPSGPVGTVNLAYSLTTSELKLTVKSVGTFDATNRLSYALTSSTLA